MARSNPKQADGESAPASSGPNKESEQKPSSSSQPEPDNKASQGKADRNAKSDSDKKGESGKQEEPKKSDPEKKDQSKKDGQKKIDPKHDFPRKRILILVAIMVLASLLVLGGFLYSRTDAEETSIELMGNIDVRQVNLAFKVDGRIDTLAVDEGSAVKSGDVLATLDKRYFNDELRIQRAKRQNLAAAVAKLEHGSRPQEIAQARAQSADRDAALVKAKEDLQRAKQLVDKGGVSRQDFDRYQTAVDQAEAQQKSAIESQRLVEIGPRQEDIDIGKAQLAEQDATIEQSERRLADADLVAPHDGAILTRARERGAIVQPGETVFALTLSTPVWVRTYVNERDLGVVSPEMSASVFTDTRPDQPYPGKIGFISPTAEFTPKSVETRDLRTDLVYRLRVLVDNPDAGLRQGMPVTVRLQLPNPRPRTFWERVGDIFRSKSHPTK